VILDLEPPITTTPCIPSWRPDMLYEFVKTRELVDLVNAAVADCLS
jgi:hypothetical protein